MEKKNEEINKKEKKEYKLLLKKIKSNENEEKKYFSKLTDMLMSYNLFPFFNIKEAKDLGKLNSKFYNAFARYYERESDELIDKYNVKIEKEKEYKPNAIYEQKDDKGHFIKLSLINLEHYLLFSYFKWTWQDDNRYWDRITPKNSILNKDICHLKTVCWVDVKANMSHIFSGKYRLYLNHCVCKLSENVLKMTVFIDNVPLIEYKYPSREQVNNCRQIHIDQKEEDKKEEDQKEEDKKEENKKEEKKEGNIELGDEIQQPRLHVLRPLRVGLMRGPFPRVRRVGGNLITYNKENSLHKEFIMDVDIIYNEILDNGNGHEIKVTFDHATDTWKNGWLIDAVILESKMNNIINII